MSLAIVRNRAKLVGLLVVVAFSLAFVPAANAASDRTICEAQTGCVYTKEGGVSNCDCPTPPPPPHAQAQKSEETSQKGSFKSSHEKEEQNCITNPSGPHCK